MINDECFSLDSDDVCCDLRNGIYSHTFAALLKSAAVLDHVDFTETGATTIKHCIKEMNRLKLP